MANDNKTALMQSIQRKKDYVEALEKEIEFATSILDDTYDYFKSRAIQDILECEITEDEKLLAVDRDRTVEFTTEMLIRYGLVESRSAYKFEALSFYHKKYGTDGK